MSRLPTIGGVVTRGEVYMKLLHHIDEIQDLTATMAHLHNTETTHMDKLSAQGWLAMHEMFKQVRRQITELAKSKFS